MSDDSRQDNLPPPYEDVMKENQRESPGRGDQTTEGVKTTHDPVTGDEGHLSSSIEFPLTHYYELEGRVHTNQWSIPYKRDESLAICMVATIKMVREGKQNCI